MAASEAKGTHMAKPETSQESADEGDKGQAGDAGLRRPQRRRPKRAASTQLAAAQVVRARRARGASGPIAVVWRPLATLTPQPAQRPRPFRRADRWHR